MPHRKILYRGQRLVLSHLILELLRLSYIYRDDNDFWGRHVDELTVAYTLLQGTLEGKFMGVQKVHNATGIPKATISRRIDDLMKAGLIKKAPKTGYKVSAEVLNSPRTLNALSQICHAIAKAESELSKMEPIKIEP